MEVHRIGIALSQRQAIWLWSAVCLCFEHFACLLVCEQISYFGASYSTVNYIPLRSPIHPHLSHRPSLTSFVSSHRRQNLAKPANAKVTPKATLNATLSCTALLTSTPFTYFWILSVGMMLIPLEEAYCTPKTSKPMMRASEREKVDIRRPLHKPLGVLASCL